MAWTSQGARGREPQPEPHPVPAATSNAAFLARLQQPTPPQRLCTAWKGSTSLNCGCLLGQGSLGPPSSEPGSPHAGPAQGWPHSVPFQFHGGGRKPEQLDALSPTSFYRPVFLSPWATAIPSGLGVPALGPSSDSEAGAGSLCCPKGKSVEWSGCFQLNPI